MKDIHLFKKNYNMYLKQQVMVRGMSMKELAKTTGYTYEGIRQILKGNGSYRGVFMVCKALRLDMRRLLKEDVLEGGA